MSFKRKQKFPTMEEMWNDFSINCLDPTYPKQQLVEMKKAFMSGIASLFHTIKFDIPEVSDEEGEGYLERIDKELNNFFTIDIFKL